MCAEKSWEIVFFFRPRCPPISQFDTCPDGTKGVSTPSNCEIEGHRGWKDKIISHDFWAHTNVVLSLSVVCVSGSPGFSLVSMQLDSRWFVCCY